MATLDQMWDDMVAHCEELEAEVERLREELRVDLGTKENVHLQRQRDAALAEVERLRAEKDETAEAWSISHEACQRLEAEVERLRALLYRATAPTASLQEAEDREAAIREGYELTRPRAALAKEDS